jgi:hypothetical protein
MAARRRSIKSRTPLDDRQLKLLAEEEKLQAEMEKLNRVIAEAPRIAEQRLKARRDELLVDRSTRAHHRLNSSTLADTRFEQFGGAAPRRARRRPLKSEKRQTILVTFGLLFALAIMIVVLLHVLHWQWSG